MRRFNLLAIALLIAACGDSTGPNGGPSPKLAVGFDHACAINGAGQAMCWGWNSFGQLGAPTSEQCAGIYPCSTVPVAVTGGRTFVAISAGGQHTCALDGDGSAWCWGLNSTGQLGNGSATPANSAVPHAVHGDHRFTAISAGGDYTCGLTAEGSAWCWGDNFSGQLGNGETARATSPVAVSGGLHFSAIAGGGSFTCGVTAAALFCWGGNDAGQLGLGDTSPRLVPTPVLPGFTARTLAPGSVGRHACGLAPDGRAYCWGSNGNYQVGDSTQVERHRPARVASDMKFTAIARGLMFTCAIATTGLAHCWGGGGGWGEQGVLGTGDSAFSVAPVPVAGGHAFVAIGSGDQWSCAMTADSRVYCWGIGFRGQTGNGSTATVYAPTEVTLP